jgi:hypothetical protein
MNLANTIEIEKFANESVEDQEKRKTITFESLKNAKNSIKTQNKEYVDFIKEIEEMSEEDPISPPVKEKTFSKNNKPKQINKTNNISVSKKRKRKQKKEEKLNLNIEKGRDSNLFSSCEYDYSKKLDNETNAVSHF